MRPYRPSNGTEGICFTEHFCDRCEKDRLYRQTADGPDGCQILSGTMIYDVNEPGYPKEWVEEDDGSNPRCTAFEKEVSEEVRAYRDAEAAGQRSLFEKGPSG